MRATDYCTNIKTIGHYVKVCKGLKVEYEDYQKKQSYIRRKTI